MISQSKELPHNWPADPHKPGEYLMQAYHACRVGLSDWMFLPHRAHSIDRVTQHIEFVQEVLTAIVHGSNDRSPFVHLSCTAASAYRYAVLGQRKRNDSAEKQMFTKINLMEMYNDGVINETNLIDISTPAAFDAFFEPLLSDPHAFGPNTMNELRLARIYAIRAQEILLCWRGKVCPHYALIISPLLIARINVV